MAHYTIAISNAKEYFAEEKNGKWFLDNEEINCDIRQIGENQFHILWKEKSFRAEVVNINFETKTVELRINNNFYKAKIKDQFDELLHKLGMDDTVKPKIKSLNAPMPGMVLKTFVKTGDEIKTGDNLVILEAMKMENILKATGAGTVKIIFAKPGDKVEKGQTLIEFE
jgi:biotin carboxyl carrier protein